MLNQLLNQKGMKAKELTEQLSLALLNGEIGVNELIHSADKLKDPEKASCIEAIEHATKNQFDILDNASFDWICKQLQSKAPRVKWESARVLGNVAAAHSDKLVLAAKALLKNTDSKEGTVVRWSSAFALSEILKQAQSQTAFLEAEIRKILHREEKESIKKIYLAAFKKLKLKV